MSSAQKLILVKVGHTAIWCFFNVVIGYMLYAVIVDRIDHWVWLCLGLVAVEVMVLVLFKMFCPLTLLARRYTEDTRPNFDIYLPEFIARHNKTIYGAIVVLIIALLAIRSAN